MVVQIARTINLCKHNSVTYHNSEKLTQVPLPNDNADVFEVAPCTPNLLQNIPWKSSGHEITITVLDTADGKTHSVSVIDDNYAFLLNGNRIGDLHPLEKAVNPKGLLAVVSECPIDPHNNFSISIFKFPDDLEIAAVNTIPSWEVRKLLQEEPVATLNGW
ncbi:hypothetical protein TWF481_004974 [Arthrobotrys musiformis]|uniref:Uncharacterized protein n=1 Tax=Arthrobotrys musiformis TaxID=47236 RepID=A0AAV9WN91_9PEZI